MDPIRAQRIAEMLREELTQLIEYELSDPRVDGAHVTEVHVSPDLTRARVMMSGKDAGDLDGALEALNGARSFLRKQIADRLQLRKTPDFQFEADAAVEPGRVASLLKRIRRGRPRDASE